MNNPFHDGSVTKDLTAAHSAPDELGRSEEEVRSDREDDDKAAEITHSYGATFAEVAYRDLPAWALEELSFG